MRYTMSINAVKCQEWGLNLAQGALFDLLNQASSWAKPHAIDGEVYYWVSRNKVLDEIPVAYNKADTVYRSLRILEEKGLIAYIKEGRKDLIKLTEKGMTWNVVGTKQGDAKLGNKSEFGNKPEINPSKAGNKSELTPENTDLNPTDKSTNNKSTNNKKESSTAKNTFEFSGFYEQAQDHLKLAGMIPAFGPVNDTQLKPEVYKFVQYHSSQGTDSSELGKRLISWFQKFSKEDMRRFFTAEQDLNAQPLHASHQPSVAQQAKPHDPSAVLAAIEAGKRKAAQKKAGVTA